MCFIVFSEWVEADKYLVVASVCLYLYCVLLSKSLFYCIIVFIVFLDANKLFYTSLLHYVDVCVVQDGTMTVCSKT